MDVRTTTKTTPTSRSGCETSSPQDTSRPVTSTSAASKTCAPTTCADTPSVISSPASGSGATPCVLPDGRMIDPFGLAAALANLSHRQVRALGLTTSGIYGPRGSTSYGTAALSSSLVSRLQVLTASLGSSLFKLIWKQRTTPAWRSISALRASGHRTSGNASTSWPTPTVSRGDYQNNPRGEKSLKLPGAAKLASWPTTRATDGDKGVRSQEGAIREAMRTKGPDLCTMAQLATWATPTTRDYKDGSYQPNVPENALLGRQAWQASGATPSGSTAEMKSSGQLNPAHSRWLMGLPRAWDDCAPTATRSSRRSPKHSSART